MQTLHSKDELCRQQGIKTYDVALPQPWLELMARLLVAYGLQDDECDAYEMVRKHTVYSYDGDNGICGAPHYLTPELTSTMGRLEDLQRVAVAL